MLAFRDQIRLARTVLILSRSIFIGSILVLLAKVVSVVTDQPLTPWVTLGIVVVVGWALYLAWHHVILPFDVARIVDRRLRLNAQIATAVETTTSDRLDLPLARTQVRQATNCLRDLNPITTIPVRLPMRDVRALAAVAAAYGAIVISGRLGVTIPRPLLPMEAELARQARSQAQSPSPFVTIDPALTTLQTQAAPLLLNRTASSAQVGGQLTNLQQQLQAQQITVDEYRSQLKQVQNQIQSQAGESLAAQEALNALAASLKDVSATQGISDSLIRGDYHKASSQLNNLSQELGQLSADSRNQIGDRLGQAATQTSKSSPAMSKSSAAASSALKSGDTSAAAQAIKSLAQSVDQAQQQIAAQSQLGQDLQNVQQQLAKEQPSGSNQNQINRPGQGTQSDNPHLLDSQSSPSMAQSSPSQSESTASRRSPDSGSPDSSGSKSYGSGDVTARSSNEPIQSSAGSSNGGAGDQPGGNTLGPSSVLDVTGVKLTIVGQASGASSGTTTAGDRSVPLTVGNDTTQNGLPASGTVPSDIPINVHQDSNVVPLDRKPVVRDYFSDAPQ